MDFEIARHLDIGVALLVNPMSEQEIALLVDTVRANEQLMSSEVVRYIINVFAGYLEPEPGGLSDEQRRAMHERYEARHAADQDAS